MRFKLLLVSIGFSLFMQVVFAQSVVPNHKDEQGLKQGYWIVYGSAFPERGYCDSCKVEEGHYVNDRKEGVWFIYHKNGHLRAKGNFTSGRLSGQYQKYNEQGLLIESGTYAQGKQIGLFLTFYPNGCLKCEKYFDTDGKEKLPLTFYFSNCDTSVSIKGQVEFKRMLSPQNEIVDSTFNAEGEYVLRSVSRSSNSYYYQPVVSDCGIYFDDSSELKQKTVNDENGHLEMEGEFKNGKLWNGRKYKYDKDGILLKIEIWQNGVYVSDQQL